MLGGCVWFGSSDFFLALSTFKPCTIARILRAFLLVSGLGGASADGPHHRLRRERPNPPPRHRRFSGSPSRCRETFTPARPMGFLLWCFEDHVMQWTALGAHLLVLLGDPLPPCRVFPGELLNVTGNRPHAAGNRCTHLRFNLLARLPEEVAHPLGWRPALEMRCQCFAADAG